MKSQHDLNFIIAVIAVGLEWAEGFLPEPVLQQNHVQNVFESVIMAS